MNDDSDTVMPEMPENTPLSQAFGATRGNTYHVLRHGEAEQNVLGILYGREDDNYALTAEGKEQVKLAVAKLAGITKIYSSPIRRARETAEIAAGVLGIPRTDIVQDQRLRELDFGVFHGKTALEFLQYRNEHIHSLSDGFPEGESYLDAKRRFGEWLYETDAILSNQNVLIVTHGIGIESLAAVAEGVSNADALAYVLHHNFGYAHIETLKFTRMGVNEDFERVQV